MSSLTRARPGNRVKFKDSSGKVVEGVALRFRSDSILVGVQDAAKPFVRICVHTKPDGTRVLGNVPNNSLWVVPFSDVIETLNNQKAA